MDVVIQQDGRIQTNWAIEPSRTHWKTVEYMPLSLAVGIQVPAVGDIPQKVPLIERTFRKIGKEGNITVWVEVP